MSSQNNGFIKIHRKLLDWQWYGSPNHTTLFLHLLLTANFKPTTWRKQTLEPGQLLTGRKLLSANTGLSERSVRTILKDLISTNELTIKSSNKFSIITIVNWDKYQANDQQTDQQTTSKRPANDHIQECKEGKKEKKENIYSDDFEKLWRISCRGSKAEAYKEYLAYCKDVDPALLEKALKKYHADNPDPKYQKHLKRWIKGKMWEGYVDRPAVVQNPYSMDRAVKLSKLYT